MYIPGESGMIAQATQVDGALFEGTLAPTVEYLHGDHQGSVNAVTKTDRPTADVTQMRFDPFGARIGTSDPPMSISPPVSPVADVTLGFTGHEQDDELGLINMGGRIYDPALARFLTPDPMMSRPWKSQSLNRYSYAENSPLRFLDPSGFDPTDDQQDKSATATTKTAIRARAPATGLRMVGRGDRLAKSRPDRTSILRRSQTPRNRKGSRIQRGRTQGVPFTPSGNPTGVFDGGGGMPGLDATPLIGPPASGGASSAKAATADDAGPGDAAGPSSGQGPNTTINVNPMVITHGYGTPAVGSS